MIENGPQLHGMLQAISPLIKFLLGAKYVAVTIFIKRHNNANFTIEV